MRLPYQPLLYLHRQSALLYYRTPKMDGNQLDHMRVGTVTGVVNWAESPRT